jgi:CubicO group peptidase (beta-lactamase class C family)
MNQELMMAYPLPTASLDSAPVRPGALDPLLELIESHIAQGRYPGCQLALAHQGRLVLNKSFGQARLGQGDPADTQAMAAQSDSLWLLYSNTKVITATALWKLHEQGRLRFTDTVADYLPEFARHDKGAITLFQVITHQGGFPDAEIPIDVAGDHARVRELVCDFKLQWAPGSRVHYHGLSAHWVLGMVIEAITGQDFREAITDLVLRPLGLENDLFMGLPRSEVPRMSFLYQPGSSPGTYALRFESTSEAWQQCGAPGGGGYGTARGMVALYQMMLQGGRLNGVQLLSPRTLAYAIRNYTEERTDEFMGVAMHRGLGPHLRGTSVGIRGLGSIASPRAFGHGGVGTSYCWADPDSGISFAYITNSRVPDPWHSVRLDQVSNLVHAAIQA